MIKITYNKPTVNVILEKAVSVFFKIRNKTKVPTLNKFYTGLEVLEQLHKRKGIQIGKEHVKLSFLADYVILCIEITLGTPSKDY